MAKTCDVCGREIDTESGEVYYQSETIETMCENCFEVVYPAMREQERAIYGE